MGYAQQRGQLAILASLFDRTVLRAMHAEHIGERFLTDTQGLPMLLQGLADALLEGGFDHAATLGQCLFPHYSTYDRLSINIKRSDCARYKQLANQSDTVGA